MGSEYAREASIDMDISIDIHGKSVDMDSEFFGHISKPVKSSFFSFFLSPSFSMCCPREHA